MAASIQVMTMKEYEFELHYGLPAQSTDPEVYLDALFEMGCDDALIGAGRLGTLALDFTREAESANAALRSAMQNVADAIPGARLIAAAPDLVNLSEMTRLMEKSEVASISRQAMRKYAYGEVKKVTQPFPLSSVFTESPLWHVDEVLGWLMCNGKVEREDRARHLQEISRSVRDLNASLEYARGRVRGFDDLAKVAG